MSKITKTNIPFIPKIRALEEGVHDELIEQIEKYRTKHNVSLENMRGKFEVFYTEQGGWVTMSDITVNHE